MDYFLVWQWTLFNATNINGFQSLLTLYYDVLYDTLMITMHALNWTNIGISMCIYVNDKSRKEEIRVKQLKYLIAQVKLNPERA